MPKAIYFVKQRGVDVGIFKAIHIIEIPFNGGFLNWEYLGVTSKSSIDYGWIFPS